MIERKIYIEIYWYDDDSNIFKTLKETAVFISRLFRHYLSKIKTKKTKRINIELFRYPNSYQKIIPIDVVNADIITIRTLFNFIYFDNLEFSNKTKYLLETVYEQLILVFERLQVNTTVLKETYDRVIESDFKVYIKLFALKS